MTPVPHGSTPDRGMKGMEEKMKLCSGKQLNRLSGHAHVLWREGLSPDAYPTATHQPDKHILGCSFLFFFFLTFATVTLRFNSLEAVG